MTTYYYGNEGAKTKKENGQLMEFLLNALKKDEVKLDLMMARNNANVCGLATFAQKLKGFPDGMDLFKKMLGWVKGNDEKDIERWAHILHIVLIHINEVWL